MTFYDYYLCITISSTATGILRLPRLSSQQALPMATLHQNKVKVTNTTPGACLWLLPPKINFSTQQGNLILCVYYFKEEKNMKLKIFDEKTLERLIVLNLVILTILILSNIIGILASIISNKSLKGLPVEALVEIYFFIVLYLYVYFKFLKKSKV